MVCSQVPPVYGGAGTQALALSRLLALDGYEIDVYTCNQLLAPRRETVAGVCVFRMPGERLLRFLPKDPARIVRTICFTTWLTVRLSKGRYDVIHAHGCYWFTLAALAASRLTRASLVVKVTQLDDDDAATLMGRRLFGMRIGWLAAAPLRFADVVVALNATIAERNVRHFPSVRVARLPNGVDTARFAYTAGDRAAARDRLEVPQNARVALFVGYITARKGVQTLLEGWWDFVARRVASDPPVRLLLVGPAAGFYRGLSMEAVEQAKSSEARARGIRCLEHVAWERMPEVYASADLFVLPTKAEGMPNSLLEALAAGLRVVTTPVPGVSELFAGDGHGQIRMLDSVTIETVSEALTFGLAISPESASRTTVLPQGLTLEHVAGVYRGLYRLLVERHRPGGEGAVDDYLSQVAARW